MKKIKINLIVLDVIIIALIVVLCIKITRNNSNESPIDNDVITESTESIIDTSCEIKNCPFCGGHAILSESDMYGYDAEIRCDECGVRISASIGCNSKEEAKEYVLSRWNKRVKE